jgi:hypothetical protein
MHFPHFVGRYCRGRLIVVSALLAAATFFATPASAQDCSQTLVNDVGDTIMVAATLQSTDPDDPDEGEGLQVVSSGGELSQFMNVYNTPFPFQSYTATKANETINGVDGEDDDETCQVFGTVGKQTLLQKTKHDIVQVKGLVDHSSTAISVGAVACALIKICKPIALGLGFAGFALSGSSEATGFLAADPPDPNYKEIALLPGFSDIDESEDDAEPRGLKQEIHTIALNEKRIIGLDQAIVTTINRISGARMAKDKHWEEVQQDRAKDFKKELGTAMLNQATYSLDLSKTLRKSKVDVAITQADVQSYISGIEQNGLPPKEMKLLTNLGFTPDDIVLIEGSIILQDPTSFDGNLSSFLADPAYIAGLKKLGNDLIKNE